jgi:DNA-directed RNA polymerase specialized sigma24 family protein
MDASDEAAIGRVLHEQFLEGDVDAYKEIFGRYNIRVLRHVAYVVRSNPKLSYDEEIAIDAAMLALTNYALSPEKYNPSLSSLLTYLRNAAYADYVNEWRKRLRQQRNIVEIEEETWNTISGDGEIVERQVELGEENARAEEFMRSLCDNDDELKILRQIIDRERDANACIVELGWPPGKESVQRLYREKDKLMKRMKRNLPTLLGEQLQ